MSNNTPTIILSIAVMGVVGFNMYCAGYEQGRRNAFDRVSQVGLKRAYLESKMTKEEVETFQRY